MPVRKKSRWSFRRLLGGLRRVRRDSVSEDSISLDALRMLDRSAANFRHGVASEPVDPELIRRLAR